MLFRSATIGGPGWAWRMASSMALFQRITTLSAAVAAVAAAKDTAIRANLANNQFLSHSTRPQWLDVSPKPLRLVQ